MTQAFSFANKFFLSLCKQANTHLTPPRRLSSYDDGEENAAHPHMMICRLRRNACIEERCQKGKEDLSQASFKYTHFAVAGKSSYEDERCSLRHHHMMISDAEGLRNLDTWLSANISTLNISKSTVCCFQNSSKSFLHKLRNWQLKLEIKQCDK